MHTSNPYAQGWLYGGGGGHGSQMPVSILGALPSYPTSNPFLSFRFTSFSPSITNSVILGPNGLPYLHVTTTDSYPARTCLRNNEGRSLATVEWYDHPVVEVPGILPRQAVGQWLRVSPDKSCRSMPVRNARVTWTVCSDSICLYTSGPAPPELIGRVTKMKNSVTLEVGSPVVQLGLLEACLTATVLLQSGRNID